MLVKTNLVKCVWVNHITGYNELTSSDLRQILLNCFVDNYMSKIREQIIVTDYLFTFTDAKYVM